MMIIITRNEALLIGSKLYFTGIPCNYGHISQRWTSSKGCLECCAARNSTEKQKDYMREYNKKRRQTEEYKAKEKEIRSKPSARKKKAEYNKSKKMREWRIQYEKKKKESDPVFAMKKRVGTLIALKIKNQGFTKRSITKDILGCDWESFKIHIERQFTKGMSWDNRSEWHLDHIIPTSSAKTEDELKVLLLFTNVRPMWKSDNISKASKILYLI